jgi:calmodulin
MRRSENAAAIEKLRHEKQEAETLIRVFQRLDKKKDGRVDDQEVHEYLRKKLQFHEYKIDDVKDMLWEVDEDCEGGLTFKAFQAMWTRLRNDKTGWEPRRFFNIIEFMMHDKDGGGSIDVEETMEILFQRFGKDKLDAAVKEFVSHDRDGDAEIQVRSRRACTRSAAPPCTASGPCSTVPTRCAVCRVPRDGSQEQGGKYRRRSGLPRLKGHHPTDEGGERPDTEEVRPGACATLSGTFAADGATWSGSSELPTPCGMLCTNGRVAGFFAVRPVACHGCHGCFSASCASGVVRLPTRLGRPLLDRIGSPSDAFRVSARAVRTCTPTRTCHIL